MTQVECGRGSKEGAGGVRAMGRRGQRERGEQGEQGGRRRGEGKGRLQCSQGAYVMRAGMFTSRGFFGPDPSTPPPVPSFNVFPSFGHWAKAFSPSYAAGKSDYF